MNLFVYVDCASFLGRFLRQVYQELVGRVLGRWSRGLQIKPSFKMGSHGRGRVRVMGNKSCQVVLFIW